jgi:hypothetical protein
MDSIPPKAVPQAAPELASEDYYFEGPLLVFTAAYHLKRGYCCGSGCRHCPFQASSVTASSPIESE